MYQTIRPHCKGNILEIGSGIGNISWFFLEAGNTITLSDIRSSYCEDLKNSFSGFDNLVGVEQINLVDPGFHEIHAACRESFDTVFALNVVEHIEDDQLAINNARTLLKKGGNLVILVPAYPALYNHFDQALGHYRRYTRKSLGSVLRKSGFNLLHQQYFNLAGIAGWYVSGKLQRHQTIPAEQMRLYDILVPFFRLLDQMIFRRVGLSVITVGKK